MKKQFAKLMACVMAAVIFCLAPMAAHAALFDTVILIDDPPAIEEGTAVKTVIYRSLNQDEKWTFDAELAADDQRFKLQGVEYNVTSTTTSRVEHVRTVETMQYLYEQEVPSQIAYTVPETGATAYLPLISAEYTETTITGRTGEVTGTVDYGYLMYKPRAANSSVMSYYDKASGRTVTGTMYLSSVTITEPAQWLDTEASLTFEGYGGQYFLIPGMTPGNPDSYIEIHSDVPKIAGREDALVKLLGLDPELFRVLSVEWDGEAREEQGVTVRNAVLHCQQYAARYAANYSAEWQLPDCKGWNATATYGGDMDILGGIPEYTITATATYALPVVMSAAVKMIIGGAVIIVVIGIFLLLALLIKRRRAKKGDEETVRPKRKVG